MPGCLYGVIFLFGPEGSGDRRALSRQIVVPLSLCFDLGGSLLSDDTHLRTCHHLSCCCWGPWARLRVRLLASEAVSTGRQWSFQPSEPQTKKSLRSPKAIICLITFSYHKGLFFGVAQSKKSGFFIRVEGYDRLSCSSKYMYGANRQSDFRFRLVLLVSLSFPPCPFFPLFS